MKHKSLSALAALVVLAGAALVAAIAARPTSAANGQIGQNNGGQVPVYAGDTQPGAFRAGVGVADALNVATLTSTTTGPSSPATAACARFTLGSATSGCRQNVPIWAHFSASGQTCQVSILYEDHDGSGTLTNVPGPSQVFTLTGGVSPSGWQDAAGKWVSRPVYFDGAGATHIRIVCETAPASGTVDFHVGSF